MGNSWYMTEVLAADHRDKLESEARDYRLFKGTKPVDRRVWRWRLRRLSPAPSEAIAGRVRYQTV
jgi:hypothetical protein